VLADFVRRCGAKPIDSDFVAGMKRHQAIDVFTESAAPHRAARTRITGPRRRLAGVIVDVAYDHCLTHHWSRFSPVPLPEYVPQRLGPICDYVCKSHSPLGVLATRALADGWLLAYATIDGLRRTFQRMSGRSRAAAGLLGAEEEIVQHQDYFESTFLDFYPGLMAAFPEGP